MNEKKDCILSKDEYILKQFDDGTKITIRDLQAEILQIMDEIHRICVKHDISYGLIAGSALGIFNYKGFIPWDDDIDVCVLRKDWAKFIEVLKVELDPKFYFQCFETDKNYNVLIPSMKIRKHNTKVVEVNYLLRNKCASGEGIYVDLVVFDDVSPSRWVDELYRLPIRLMMPFMVILDNLGINPLLMKKAVVLISEIYAKRNTNSPYIFQQIAIPWEIPFKNPLFRKEDVLPFKLYEFEGRHYYSYRNIEKTLIERYGKSCLKKWDGTQWIETLPLHQRKAKHIVDIKL